MRRLEKLQNQASISEYSVKEYINIKKLMKLFNNMFFLVRLLKVSEFSFKIVFLGKNLQYGLQL